MTIHPVVRRAAGPALILAATAAAIAVMSSFARAQDSEALTVSQCVTASAGITALNYAGRQMNDARPVPADPKFYKFDGGTLWRLAKAQQRLSAVVDAYQKTSREIVARAVAEIDKDAPAFGPNSVPRGQDGLTSAQRARVNEEGQKVLDQPCKVDFQRLRQSELKLCKEGEDKSKCNDSIPPDVLAALSYIIVDDVQ